LKPEEDKFNVKICFTPLDHCEDQAHLDINPPTYIVDNGNEFRTVEF